MSRTLARALPLLVAMYALAACGTDGIESGGLSGSAPTGGSESVAGQTITLVTHDSFAISEGTLEAFTAETDVTVVVQSAGDTGQMVSSAILTAGDPLGDVMFGVDNTFLQRALDAGLFEAYESPALSGVPEELWLDPQHRVTPVDFGDVCINYWIDRFGDDVAAPTTLADRPGRPGVRRPAGRAEPRDLVARSGIPAGHHCRVRRRLGGLLGRPA